MKLRNWMLGLTICIGALSEISANAADQKKADTTNVAQNQTPGISADQRKAMAEMHQKMAECLKSDSPLQECQNQMRQNCQNCNGMMWHQGSMGHHHGMMGNGMDWGYCGMGTSTPNK